MIKRARQTRQLRQPQPAQQPDDDWKKGLPPDADAQLHRVMVEAGIWDEAGNTIPDPNFWLDVASAAGPK